MTRLEIVSSTSYGSRAQSAVIASSEVTARIDDRVRVRALVPLHADGADRREHREALPQLAIEVGAADLLEQDRVRRAQDREPLLA